MWISKKRWEALEKRVADLEGKVQSQLDVKVDTKALQEMLQNLERFDLSVGLSLTDIEFSRENLNKFVEELTKETTKILISISPDGDEAVLFVPFSRNALTVKSGEMVVMGDTVHGSIPDRHTISIRSSK